MDSTAIAQSIIASHEPRELSTMAKIDQVVGRERFESNAFHCEVADLVAQAMDVWA